MNRTTVNNSTSLAKFILRNEGYSCTLKVLLNFFIIILFSYSSIAQDSTITNTQSPNHQISKSPNQKADTLTKQEINKRIKIVAAANIVGYSAVMVGLYSAWYKD